MARLGYCGDGRFLGYRLGARAHELEDILVEHPLSSVSLEGNVLRGEQTTCDTTFSHGILYLNIARHIYDTLTVNSYLALRSVFLNAHYFYLP